MQDFKVLKLNSSKFFNDINILWLFLLLIRKRLLTCGRLTCHLIIFLSLFNTGGCVIDCFSENVLTFSQMFFFRFGYFDLIFYFIACNAALALCLKLCEASLRLCVKTQMWTDNSMTSIINRIKPLVAA